MPEMTPAKRASGGWVGDLSEPDEDTDWSVPTDLETLRRRRLPRPDQSRYGPNLSDSHKEVG